VIPPGHGVHAAANIHAAVMTVSDTRTAADDSSGAAIRGLMTEARHVICAHAIVRDEPSVIRQQIIAWCAGETCETILITGGTGFAPRDVTIDAVTPLFEKHMDGFGELFRALSFAEIGPAAMLSRAAAGICGRTVIFCMPGSNAAVTLAMKQLVLPTLPHVVALLRPDRS